jgi:hypothetical protein
MITLSFSNLEILFVYVKTFHNLSATCANFKVRQVPQVLFMQLLASRPFKFKLECSDSMSTHILQSNKMTNEKRRVTMVRLQRFAFHNDTQTSSIYL